MPVTIINNSFLMFPYLARALCHVVAPFRYYGCVHMASLFSKHTVSTLSTMNLPAYVA